MDMTQVTVVATPAQLQAASIAGAQYIEVQAHLDLRHLGRLRHNDLPRDSPLRELKTPQALFYIHQNMTSLRVRALTLQAVRGVCIWPTRGAFADSTST